MISIGSILSLVILCLGYSASRKIPSYVTLCHRDDPNLSACVLNAVKQLKPHLADGVPDLLIPPMNPLVLPEASLNATDNFKASFKNIKIFYAHEFVVDNLIFDFDKVHIDLKLSFPRLRIMSQYAVDGKILILQLKGEGPADGNFTNVSGRLVVDGGRYMKQGKEYIDLKNKMVELNLGKPVFYFDNIFRENRELNDQTNKIVNENIVDIIDELRPVVDKTVTEFAFGIVARIFDRFPVDELFPK